MRHDSISMRRDELKTKKETNLYGLSRERVKMS